MDRNERSWRIFQLGVALGQAIAGADEALKLLATPGTFSTTTEARCVAEAQKALEHLKQASAALRGALND